MPPRVKPVSGGVSKQKSAETRAKHANKLLVVKSYTKNATENAIREQNFRNFVKVEPRASSLANLGISNQKNWENRHSTVFMWEFTNSELKQYPAMVYLTNKTKEGGKVDVVSVFFHGMFRTVLVNYIDAKPFFYIDYNTGPKPEEQGILNGRFVPFDQGVFNTEKHMSGPTSPASSPPVSPRRSGGAGASYEQEMNDFLNMPIDSPLKGRSRSASPVLSDYDSDHYRFGSKKSRKVKFSLRQLKNDLKKLILL